MNSITPLIQEQAHYENELALLREALKKAVSQSKRASQNESSISYDVKKLESKLDVTAKAIQLIIERDQIHPDALKRFKSESSHQQ